MYRWPFPPLAPLLVLLFACGGDPGREAPPGCREAADCAVGEVCDDGSCRPEGLRGCHPPCGGTQPVCDEARGYCKVCTDLAGCGGSTPHCAVAANGGEGACVGCRDDADCTAPSVCDPATHACAGCTATVGCSGDTPICAGGTCVACTETEGCGGYTPVCDAAAAGGTCVVCTATAGCGDGEVCDVSVAGGACVTCTTGLGCHGDTPVCDTAVPGGACVECIADGDCDAGRRCDEAAGRCVTCLADGEGCTPPRLHCDVAAADGRGACVGCRNDLDCAGLGVCHPERKTCVACTSDLDCGGATPVCDPDAFAGEGACVACVDAGDCGGATPVCDRAANDGTGDCVACTEAEGCDAGRFCDPAARACVVCTEERGCAGDRPVCDTTVVGGACVVCAGDVHCTADPARPLCDRSRTTVGACVRCTTEHRGCDGETPYCRPGADWGAGVCTRCTETLGCGGATPVCDLTVAGGACVVCTANAGCGGATPVCDTAVPGGACKVCVAGGEGCYWVRPACDVEAAGGLGACVLCASPADCASPTPTCDLATHTCVGCVTSADCTGYLPVCDTAAKRCVACTPTEGCDTARPFCEPDWAGQNRCLECRGSSDCEPEVEACHTVAGDCLNIATYSIQGVRSATSSNVYSATVTYLKPQVGGDPAGFFVQGEAAAPALFVAVAPSSLSPPPAVGDRVSFQVTSRATVDRMLRVTGLSGWTVGSGGHPVAPLVQDVTHDPAIVVRPAWYESELISLTGELEAFGPFGTGFVAAPLALPLLGPSPALQLRLPEALQTALDLTAGCVVTVTAVPYWYTATAVLPTAHAPADFSAVACPAPRLVAAAAVSPTEVALTFDRVIGAVSVLADGSQFTVSPPLAVSSAVPSGRTVTLTTAPQTAGTGYAVTADGTVEDLHGAGVAPPGTATFVGHP